MLYIVHFTAFCLGGPFFSGHGVYDYHIVAKKSLSHYSSASVGVGWYAVLYVVVLLSLQGYDGEKFLYIWVYGMVFDRLYDIFIGIYILSWIGGHRFTVSS